MTEIEAKALALWGPGIAAEVNLHNFAILGSAFIEMRDRHEAFKQEVSDVVKYAVRCIDKGVDGHNVSYALSRFIINPKPDPLVRVINEVIYAQPDGDISEVRMAKEIRAALEARGLEIREKGQ